MYNTCLPTCYHRQGVAPRPDSVAGDLPPEPAGLASLQRGRSTVHHRAANEDCQIQARVLSQH